MGDGDTKNAIIKGYEARGFKEVELYTFEDDDNRKRMARLLLSAPEMADLGTWFRRGSLIYEDGSIADLKVVVLFGDEAWHLGSSTKVAQRRRGRPAHISKVLERPFLLKTLSRSDYAVCLGLASAEAASSDEVNDQLSDDRAANLCRAIANLGYLSSEYVCGLGLGHAKTNADDADILRKQRSVVIVGVDVIGQMHVSDIARVSADMITLDGVRIDDYSRSETGYTVFRNIGKGEYSGASQLQSADKSDDEFFLLTEPY